MDGGSAEGEGATTGFFGSGGGVGDGDAMDGARQGKGVGEQQSTACCRGPAVEARRGSLERPAGVEDWRCAALHVLRVTQERGCTCAARLLASTGENPEGLGWG